jgi:hypothetical protein
MMPADPTGIVILLACAPGGIRTPGHLLRRQLLFPLSYRGNRFKTGESTLYR